MHIISESDGRARCLRLAGELTIYNAMAVKEALLDALADASEVVLDLEAVAEIDTSGVQLLITAVREAKSAGKLLRLQGASAAVLGLIELYDLSGWFGDSLALSSQQVAHEGAGAWA